MHNSAFNFYGYNGIYLPFEITDIAAGIAAVRTLGIKGLSVTLPHKVTVMDYLDEVDTMADRIGAVNTIVNSDGVLSGHNTDVLGALEALYEKTAIKDKDVVIIGAGGAARAIGHGIIDNGGRVTVVNRSIDKGEKLAARLNAAFLPLAEAQKASCDIMINTTSVGMQPDNQSTPIPKSVFYKDMTVMDIIYTPLKTRFLKKAEAAGCKTINGLPMFIHQGAYQFKLWTGLEAPLETMRDAVLEALSN
jgi:shikimate dehydrogenase